MIEQLFGSKTRVMLLRLFLNNPEKFYYVRELTRNLDTHINSVRRELDNLQKMGIISFYTKEDLEREIEKEIKDNKKYYKLNNDFMFISELTSLLNKAHVILDKTLAKRVENLGDVKFFLLSGIFVGREDVPIDMLAVGTINRNKLRNLARTFEKELGKPINYTIMTRSEFQYRYNITDRFLYDLLGGKNMVIIDSLLVKIKK
ncbi:MAG: hypothetical protein Q7K65_00915 [Candidatus Buchananbacteria bacterium]|nr:hypothetical protein [Candidatus Buchananbacteria bacterium]